ncbi:MAG: hypothetical protein NXI28_25770, partial [bacterium]|nr:hypothetical protein [bacterium]
GPKHKNATALGKPDRFASFAMNPHSTRQPSASIPAGKRRAEHYCPRPFLAGASLFAGPRLVMVGRVVPTFQSGLA